MEYTAPPQRLRRIHRGRLLVLIPIILLFVISRSALGPSATADQLKIIANDSVPLTELSGLAYDYGDLSGTHRIVGIGDRNPQTTSFLLDKNRVSAVVNKDFSKQLLDEFSVCSDFTYGACADLAKNLTSNWEGIATDRNHLFFLQEHSSAVVVFDRSFNLDYSKFGYTQLKNRFAKDAKLSEGILLLKNGHVAIVKESDPMTIVEFGPAGDHALGVGRHSILRPGQLFALSRILGKQRTTLVPLANWRFGSKYKCDGSDLTFDVLRGKMYIISQKCRTITEVAELTQGQPLMQTLAIWSIPRKIKNPESILIAPNGDFIVGSDRQSSKKPNLFVLQPTN